jgi:hypothetical protein
MMQNFEEVPKSLEDLEVKLYGIPYQTPGWHTLLWPGHSKCSEKMYTTKNFVDS